MHLSGFSTGSFKVIKKEPKTLILRHGNVLGLIQLGTGLGFSCVWYYLLLEKPGSLRSAVEVAIEKVDSGVQWWVLMIAPLIAIGGVAFKFSETLLSARKIDFDGISRTVRYGRESVDFSRVAKVQLRRILGGESGDEYLLSLVLSDERVLRLVSHSDKDRIMTTGADIADLLGSQVEYAGGWGSGRSGTV